MVRDGIGNTECLLDSVLMIGQSNMAGRGELNEVKPIRNPMCYMLRMGRWQPMSEPVNPDRSLFDGRYRSGVSLAASFADDYVRQLGRPLGLIPCADGGTTLSQWMPGEPNYDHAVALTKLALRSSRLTAILWHQGESDCVAEETVRTYRTRFLEMITRLRRDLNAEHVPLILGELPQTIGESWKTQGREAQLNQILRELARELPNCAIASSLGLTLKPDGVHFDSPACREFGHRYFAKYLELKV